MTDPRIQALIDLGPELESDLQWFRDNKSPSMVKRFEIMIAAIEALAKKAGEDDLVQRLEKGVISRGDHSKWEIDEADDLMSEAAARITELEAENERLAMKELKP